ncbi:MAG: hypothetical protein K9J85_06750 [Desulfobacteraceae bacterium]|nr:hypothetical protein [Desulfobacteraceae bacterium]
MIPVYILCGLSGAGFIFIALRKTAKLLRKNAQKKVNACWSIGYMRLNNPFEPDLTEDMPSYNKFNINESAEALADPFVICSGDKHIYLFHEIVLKGVPPGKIAVSVFDQKNNRWEYKGVVIDEPFHLSYPYVFYANENYYMIPETKAAKSVRLYKAIEFPLKWRFVKSIIKDRKLVDPSIVWFEGKFYLFANRKKRLYLYYAGDLTGQWAPHPKSPVRRGNYARCAGRIIEYKGELFRPAQELSKGYGNSMRFFRIRRLSDKEYREEPAGRGDFLHPFGNTWARFGMHHYDVLKLAENDYFAVFDGKGVPVLPV